MIEGKKTVVFFLCMLLFCGSFLYSQEIAMSDFLDGPWIWPEPEWGEGMNYDWIYHTFVVWKDKYYQYKIESEDGEVLRSGPCKIVEDNVLVLTSESGYESRYYVEKLDDGKYRLAEDFGDEPQQAPYLHVERKGPVDGPQGEDENLWVESTYIHAGDPLVVYYSGLDDNDWFSLVPAGSPDDYYDEDLWTFADDDPNGEYTFQPWAGLFELRLYRDWPDNGYTVEKRITIEVAGHW